MKYIFLNNVFFFFLLLLLTFAIYIVAATSPTSHHIYNDFFNDDSVKRIFNIFGNFDVITANNVFAHTRDLNNFVKNMGYLLKKDGLISIEVQYLPKLISNCYIDMIYHEHTSYHHLKPLNKLFEK